MKYLSTFAIFIFSIIICFAQSDPNAPKTWASNSLKGKVKSIKTVATYYEKKKTDTVVTLITFNATGYVVQYEDLTGTSYSDPHLYDYFYNENNRIIKTYDGKDTNYFDYDETGCLVRKGTEEIYWVYTCDSLGRTIKAMHYKKDKITQENYITYNSNGLVLTWQYKYKKINSTTKYTYNKKGQVIRNDYSKGSPRIYKYNKEGDKIANYPDGNKYRGYIFKYIYDEKGDWIEKKMKDNKGNLYVETYRTIVYF